MDTALNETVTLIFLHASFIVLGVSVLILAEAVAYIFFPRQIKSFFARCPLWVLRAAGVVVLGVAVIILLLYFRALRPLLL